MRAGSVTHHADPNQRCVQLDFINNVPVEGGPLSLKVFTPTKWSGVLPKGYYMLFLVTNQTVHTQGTPSQAVWVKVVS